MTNDALDLDIFEHTFRNRDANMEPNFNFQFKADLAAQDVIFDSFILSDFITFGKNSSETKQLLYVLDGIVLLPSLLIFNKFALNAEPDQFTDIFNKNDAGVAVAMTFASIFFFLRPIVISELHMTYYRKQLSDASKYNFMALTIFLPVLAAIIILGLVTSSTNIEIPFTSGLQLFICVIAYWQLLDLERRYISEKQFSATMASFMPLNPNPELSARERKLGGRYDFER